MGEESVQEPAVVSTDELDYGTQVYIAASVLILLVFISSMIVVFDDQYSANLKLGASFVGLLLLVFALYGAYSTYSKTTDVSVAELGATCYDVIDKVCGTDGRTYRNDCLAEAAGVEVACKGECPCSEGSSASFYGTSCGNGVCESGEDVFRTIDKYSGLTAGCPQDCIVCGDGICDIGEADVDTCDTGTSRESTDLKRHCEAKEGTCPADCKAIAQETAVCGVMDKNGDGKLTIVDFAAFVKVYQKKCVSAAASLDTSAKTGCGNQDTNSDGVINLIDFSSFVKRYNKASCALTAQ
ncbi:hypothetical protein JW978_02765 [Candidatus Dojkabacteria bacterium]|nr:hypothetical protein [Candidatus Dojkabacteria bacterium]